MDASKVIGARIRRLREEKGLSQPELATKIRIKQPSLSAIESGKTKVLRGPTLAGLCRELGAGVDALLKPTPDDLSPSALASEAEMVSLWRALSAEHQAVLLTTARAFRNAMVATRRENPSVLAKADDTAAAPAVTSGKAKRAA